eukprot:644767-Pelagomonas_calceolata.AAC.1
MVLAPLPGTEAALMLSLCALSQADKLTSFQDPSSRQGYPPCWAEILSRNQPLRYLETATAQHAHTITGYYFSDMPTP